MNFLSALLKNDKDEHDIKTRRMQAMRDIIAVIGPAPFVPDPFIDHKIANYDFENEEWLVDQMEKVPMVISKLIEKCDIDNSADRDLRYHTEKTTRRIEELERENTRLKEENELLKSDKVKVVILRE